MKTTIDIWNNNDNTRQIVRIKRDKSETIKYVTLVGEEIISMTDAQSLLNTEKYTHISQFTT